MKRRYYYLAVMWGLLLVLSFGSATPEVRTGIGPLALWDFSDSAVAPNTWDISVLQTAESGIRTASSEALFLWTGRGITVMPPGTTYDEVTEAPTDTTLYEGLLLFQPSRIWIVRTRENHFAKLRFLDDLQLTNLFEYTYQDDGTPFFFDPVPVEETTWGRIKSLYK